MIDLLFDLGYNSSRCTKFARKCFAEHFRVNDFLLDFGSIVIKLCKTSLPFISFKSFVHDCASEEGRTLRKYGAAIHYYENLSSLDFVQ